MTIYISVNKRNYNNLLQKCIDFFIRMANNKYVLNTNNVCKATWTVIKAILKIIYILNIVDVDDNEEIKKITEPIKIATYIDNYFVESITKSNYDIQNTILLVYYKIILVYSWNNPELLTAFHMIYH